MMPMLSVYMREIALAAKEIEMPDDGMGDGGYGGSGDGFGGGDPGFGGGFDGMAASTTNADMATVGATAIAAALGTGAITGFAGAGLAVVGVGLGSYGSPFGTAVVDLTRDASLSGPGLFGADMSPADLSGGAGVGSGDANAGMVQEITWTPAGAIAQWVPQPNQWAVSSGGSGSEGGGGW